MQLNLSHIEKIQSSASLLFSNQPTNCILLSENDSDFSNANSCIGCCLSYQYSNGNSAVAF